MATVVDSEMPDSSSDANFRAWGKSISDALASVGLVKTGDTGQIDWATVTAPAGANTAQGYEIWRFDDTLQSTAPVYIKLEYGSAGAAARPSIWYTVGDGSDGSGNLTGATSTRTQASSAGNLAAAKSMYYSGDTNRLSMALFQDNAAANYTIILVIERTHDATGADTADGVLILSNNNGGTTFHQQYFELGVGATTQENSWGVLAPTVGTGASGANYAVFPCMLTNGTFVNPPKGCCAAFRADVSGGGTASLTIYGASIAYYATGASTDNVERGGGAANPVQALVRYD